MAPVIRQFRSLPTSQKESKAKREEKKKYQSLFWEESKEIKKGASREEQRNDTLKQCINEITAPVFWEVISRLIESVASLDTLGGDGGSI